MSGCARSSVVTVGEAPATAPPTSHPPTSAGHVRDDRCRRCHAGTRRLAAGAGDAPAASGAGGRCRPVERATRRDRHPGHRSRVDPRRPPSASRRGTIAAPVDYARRLVRRRRASRRPGIRAIIAGHVDSQKRGGEVFYRLDELQPDDPSSWKRSDGTAVTYRATKRRAVPRRTTSRWHSCTARRQALRCGW